MFDATGGPQDRRYARKVIMLETLPVLAVLNEIQEGALLIDLAGAVHFLNPMATRMLGIHVGNRQDYALRDLFSFIDNTTRRPVADPMAYLLSGGQAGRAGSYELLVRSDGSTLPVDFTVSRLNGAGEDAADLVLVMIRDASRTSARIDQLMDAARHDEHTHLLRRGEPG